jgi:hypothetical protein
VVVIIKEDNFLTLYVSGEEPIKVSAVFDLSEVPEEYRSSVIATLRPINLHTRHRLHDPEYMASMSRLAQEVEDYNNLPFWKKWVTPFPKEG